MTGCGLCKALKESKKVIWYTRSTYADDNISEYIGGLQTASYFELSGYQSDDGNTYVGVEYTEQYDVKYMGEDLTIKPFSEMIHFNFCPICGRQISKEVKEFDDYRHQMKVED